MIRSTVLIMVAAQLLAWNPITHFHDDDPTVGPEIGQFGTYVWTRHATHGNANVTLTLADPGVSSYAVFAVAREHDGWNHSPSGHGDQPTGSRHTGIRPRRNSSYRRIQARSEASSRPSAE